MLAQIESFAGINNVDSDRRIQKYTFGDNLVMLSGDLKSCVNFRIPKDGFPIVRNGMTQKRAATDLTVLWVSRDGNTAIFTDGAYIKLLNADYSTTNLYTTLTPNRDMAITEHNQKVFFANGVQMLKYVSGTVSAWADTSQTDEEFEMPQRTYRGLPLSDVILSYYARMYVAWGRYVFWSDSQYPERFRKAWYLVVPEDVTALSCDDNCLYVHTLNMTIPFVGRDPDDFIQLEPKPIGAIKHYPGIPYALPNPVWISKKGWATGQAGQVAYIDDEHFRLDLPDTARCYAGYHPANREIIASIRY